jgi:hypothetical protein
VRIKHVTLREILGATRQGAATLVPEWAGYLLLGLGRSTACLPLLIDLDRVRLSSEGVLSIEGDNQAMPMADALAQLQNLLQNMLELANGYMPGLERAARQHGDSIDDWMKGLRRALIPMNRAAAKRSLARLARETLRAAARGRIATIQDREFLGSQCADTPSPDLAIPVKPNAPQLVAVGADGEKISLGKVVLKEPEPARPPAEVIETAAAAETPVPEQCLDDLDASDAPPSMDLEATPTYVDLALSTGHHSAASEPRDSVEILLAESDLEPEQALELQAKELNELVSPPPPRVIHCHRNAIKRVSLLQPLHLEVPHSEKTDETFDGAAFLSLTNALHELLEDGNDNAGSDAEPQPLLLTAVAQQVPSDEVQEKRDELTAAEPDDAGKAEESTTAAEKNPSEADRLHRAVEQETAVAADQHSEAPETSQVNDEDIEQIDSVEPMASLNGIAPPPLNASERIEEIEVDFSLGAPSARPGDVCQNPADPMVCGGKAKASAPSTPAAQEESIAGAPLLPGPPKTARSEQPRWLQDGSLMRSTEQLSSQRFSEEFDDLEWSPEPGRNSQTPSGQTLDESLALRGSIPLFFPSDAPPKHRIRKAVGTLMVAATVAAIGIAWKQRPGLFQGIPQGASTEGSVANINQCKAVLRLRDLPSPHEVLLKLGTAPFESRALPSGVRLELIATKPPLGAKRIVLSPKTIWTKTETGRFLALDVELSPASNERIWPAYEAATVGGSGPPGRVRFESPVGANLWLVAAYGLGRTADVGVPCKGGADILIVNPDAPQQRRRLRIEQELLQAASTTDGVELSAQPR